MIDIDKIFLKSDCTKDGGLLKAPNYRVVYSEDYFDVPLFAYFELICDAIAFKRIKENNVHCKKIILQEYDIYNCFYIDKI